jgi:hypothetical protein
VIGFFEIGSGELFAWAGFELWSSRSLPPEKLGLQVWATGTRLMVVFLKEFSLGWWSGSSARVPA